MEQSSSQFANQLRIVWIAWLGHLLFVFSLFISACAAASDADSKSFGFVTVWISLQTVAFSVFGTMALRKESLRTPLNVGFMICFAFALAMQVLELGVLAGGNIARFGGVKGSSPSSEKAVTGFSVLLFLSYSAITALFVMYRQALLPASAMSSLDESVPHRVGDTMYEQGGVKHDGIDVTLSSSHSNVV